MPRSRSRAAIGRVPTSALPKPQLTADLCLGLGLKDLAAEEWTPPPIPAKPIAKGEDAA